MKSSSGNEVWKKGEWKHFTGPLLMCESGFHCSSEPYDAFSYVQGEILVKVEVKGTNITGNNKEVWCDMKVVKVWKWQKKDSLKLAIYSADLVLKNYEKEYPKDMRPRQAIEAAKKVLFEDTEENRSAAESARSAARSAWSAA